MALDLSKFNFFSRLDARARVFVLLATVVGVFFLAYIGVRFLFVGGATTGATRLAVPQGIQSVPGGETATPEYQRVLEQASAQRAQLAQISGTSAVPTQINYGAAQQAGGCVVCEDQTANIKYDLDEWSRQGKISPDLATLLQQMADKSVPVAQFADELAQLVKDGKLTPEQARKLLEIYKKQYADAVLLESAKMMDNMIKSGELPLDVANQLLAAQKDKVPAEDYGALLQRLSQDKKISPQVAKRLLAQYAQMQAQEAAKDNVAKIKQMAQNGEITPDVSKELTGLVNRGVSLDDYAAALKRDVEGGKLTPVAATKLLEAYSKQKGAVAPALLSQLIKQAEDALDQELRDLLNAGKISANIAATIANLAQKNVSLPEFQNALSQLVLQKKLSPEVAKLKVGDYTKIRKLRDLAGQLATLQGNNAPPNAYIDALKQAVKEGALAPEQAARIMQEYQVALAKTAAPSVPPPAGSTEAFTQLQQRVQQAAPATQTVAPSADFAAAQAQAEQAAREAQNDRIQSLMTAMSTQAQQLVASWQPIPMVHKEGSPPVKPTKDGKNASKTEGGTSQTGKGGMPLESAPIIKSGTIYFAVLDTAVNSDYPDSPILATIVQGKYKGAKLLGKIVTTKGVAGQMDRVTLNFKSMDMEDWPKTKNITAYAIDPDTARTVLASAVNYHYMLRFGAIMATAFLQGYATAITTSSSTTTTGIFGTSTTHPELSPGQKLAVGLGQVGQALGNVTQNYANIPPTVKVDSGVGLGILFMSDVS